MIILILLITRNSMKQLIFHSFEFACLLRSGKVVDCDLMLLHICITYYQLLLIEVNSE